jgi:integrase/recombinase XerD
VLFTLLTVGLRVQELCLLKMNSLEQVGEHWRLHVVAKGNEQHSPLIHKVTAQVLQDYKEEFRSGARLQDPLFVRVQKTAVPTLLNRSSVFDMVKVVVKESGVLKHLSPHACRATVATLLHGQGVPIMHIQQLLNHKHITTTSLYVKKADELGEAATQKIQFLDSV